MSVETLRITFKCLLRRCPLIYGSLKMQCLQVLYGSMTEYPLMRGVCLWKVQNVVFLLSGSMTECPLRRGVCLWEVKNAVFLLSGSMTERLLRRDVCFNGRFKMQCLQVLYGSMTECLLRRSETCVCLWERLSEVSAYGARGVHKQRFFCNGFHFQWYIRNLILIVR